MAIEGTIKSLYSDFQETKAIFPRTKVKAISDDNNVGLDFLLAKMTDDIDKRATQSDVANAIANAQLADKDIDLSGLVSQDEFDVLSELVGETSVSAQIAAAIDEIPEAEVFAAEESVDTFAEVINADTLGGSPAADFATKQYVDEKMADADFGGPDSDLVVASLKIGDALLTYDYNTTALKITF